jgi:hypothetical protein
MEPTNIRQRIKLGARNILFISITTFIIFGILAIIHYTYIPFIPYLPREVATQEVIPDTYLKKSLYTSSSGSDRTPTEGSKLNLLDTTLTIDKFATVDFTFSFDFYVSHTYRSIDVPRVLFYFASSKVSITRNSELKEYKGDATETPKLLTSNETDLISNFSNTNFIVYMDPVKNDLKIAVITEKGSDKYVEIACIIKNIQINKSIKITIVLTSKFIEVYKNKELHTTYTIGTLVPRTSGPVRLFSVNKNIDNFGIYSPIDFIRTTIKVANIQYFNTVLTSSQIRTLLNPLSSEVLFL